jgi:hypothetical protein
MALLFMREKGERRIRDHSQYNSQLPVFCRYFIDVGVAIYAMLSTARRRPSMVMYTHDQNESGRKEIRKAIPML